jgi:hypothetical protein
MSRLPRICPMGMAQHIIQRGNNRQICFGSEQDFFAYVRSSAPLLRINLLVFTTQTINDYLLSFFQVYH